jgi:XapX domain-containing protein
MKLYLLSLATGIFVGVIYSMLGVRSPAPPAIALLGLLGMLLGEQAVPLVKRLARGEPVMPYVGTSCAEHVLGSQAGRAFQQDTEA